MLDNALQPEIRMVSGSGRTLFGSVKFWNFTDLVSLRLTDNYNRYNRLTKRSRHAALLMVSGQLVS